MSVNDPILEALTFALENDLAVLAPSAAETAATDTNSESASEIDTESQHRQGNKVGSGTNASISNQGFRRSSDILGEQETGTTCPFKDCSYVMRDKICSDKKQRGEFFAHLLTEHKLVIENSDEIANLSLYLNYWKNRFSAAPLSEYCVGFIMEEPPKPPEIKVKKQKKKLVEESAEANSDSKETGASDSVKASHLHETPETTGAADSKEDRMYFMLTPALPEDKQLRKDLWKRRLDVVLEVNRREREDNNFCRRCLFCRDVISGNRSEYFTHMRDSHSFHIGQPDNLVFIHEFIQCIEDKLNRLECLFCENVFKDKTVLKEHMRKKQHRKINPKNHDYDKFYVVNYLEPGKTWEMLELEDAEDERKEDEWVEPVEEKLKTIVCLFCEEADSDFHRILIHMDTKHNFNFAVITSSFDFYQKVKLVNFIRRTVYQKTCLYCEKHFEDRDILLQHISEHSNNGSLDVLPELEQWTRPEYFFPTYEDDDFLTCLEADDDSAGRTRKDSISSEGSNVIPEDLPQLDIKNRDFDLAGFALRFHNYNNN